MQLARSMIERITAQTIIPMVTLGFSGAMFAAVMEVFRRWRAEFDPVRASRRSR